MSGYLLHNAFIIDKLILFLEREKTVESFLPSCGSDLCFQNDHGNTSSLPKCDQITDRSAATRDIREYVLPIRSEGMLLLIFWCFFPCRLYRFTRASLSHNSPHCKYPGSSQVYNL